MCCLLSHVQNHLDSFKWPFSFAVVKQVCQCVGHFVETMAKVELSPVKNKLSFWYILERRRARTLNLAGEKRQCTTAQCLNRATQIFLF